MERIGGAPSDALGPHARALADHGPEAGNVPQTPTRPPRAARLKTTPVARRKLPMPAAADTLDGARAIEGAAAVPGGATSAHRPPLHPGSSAAAIAVAPPAPFAALTPSGTHAETTTAHAPASVPALAANPPPAPTPPSTPLRKRQLHAGGTVSVPAPSPPKRPKYIAKAGPIEVTRAEMAPLVRALQRPRGPSDNVNALVGATIGYLLATPLAYRSLVYRSVAM